MSDGGRELDWAEWARKRASFRAAKAELLSFDCIAQDGPQVRDLTTLR